MSTVGGAADTWLIRLRRNPYGPPMLLGLVIAWVGVGHWLLHAIGWLADYRGIFHAMAQVQGFIACFVSGFLFTMLPRRTGTAPPATWHLAVAMVAPIGLVVTAWDSRWLVSQLFWLALLTAWTSFIIPRARWDGRHRAPPDAFVWLWGGLVLGWVGAGLGTYFGVAARDAWWIHGMSRAMTLQGVFLCLVLGAASLVGPLMTRGDAPSDGENNAAGSARRTWHAMAIFVLGLSFLVEQKISLPLAMLLRGLLCAGFLVLVARLHRPPNQPGLHRWLIWVAAWAVPVGYLAASLLAERYKAGLHLVFIGGLTLLALSVAAHVILGHGGYAEDNARSPVQLVIVGVALVAAVVARALMDFDPEHFFLWMGLAAGSFLLGTLVWALYVVPRLRPRPTRGLVQLNVGPVRKGG